MNTCRLSEAFFKEVYNPGCQFVSWDFCLKERGAGNFGFRAYFFRNMQIECDYKTTDIEGKKSFDCRKALFLLETVQLIYLGVPEDLYSVPVTVFGKT